VDEKKNYNAVRRGYSLMQSKIIKKKWGKRAKDGVRLREENLWRKNRKLISALKPNSKKNAGGPGTGWNKTRSIRPKGSQKQPSSETGQGTGGQRKGKIHLGGDHQIIVWWPREWQ